MWNLFGPSTQSVNARQAIDKMQNGWRPHIIDVRSNSEIRSTGVCQGTARVIEHRDILSIAAELPEGKDLLVYCQRGGRSAMAVKMLKSAGIEPARLYNLSGGFSGWKNAGGSTKRWK